jgi:uncharacterized membrane protein (UPF0182 family)
VQSELNGVPEVATFVRDLRGTDSDIEYGNLLTVPLDGGFLYIEPVYARGGAANYPLLKKVAVAYGGGRPVFKDSLTEALNAVFEQGSAEQPPSTTPPDTTPPTTPPDTTQPPATGQAALQDAIQDAVKARADAKAALAKDPQDWTAYGKAQAELEDALKRAEAALPKVSPSPTPPGD